MKKTLAFQLFKTLGFSAILMTVSTPSWALGIQDILRNVALSLGELPKFLGYCSYITGLVFLITALMKVRSYADPTGQRVPFFEVWTRFAAAAFFIAFPYTLTLLSQTTGLEGNAFNATISNTGGTPGSGLDGMLVRLMNAIYTPLKFLIPAVCYLIGIIYAMIGIHRLTKNPSDGPRGPTGRGTLTTFLVSAILMAVGSSFDQIEHSLFGNDITVVHMVLSYTGNDPGVFSRINAVMPSILMFFSVIGWISFVRGFLMLRNLAEGHQASMLGGITHIVGGVMAANMPMVLAAVQATLGFSLVQTT